jgi:hypothetical protein
VEVWEAALSRQQLFRGSLGRLEVAISAPSPLTPVPWEAEGKTVATVPLHWQDEIRCLELDEAARRSVERRRASTLDYQEATEETGFKGTMTLVGCALIWGSLVALLLSAWLPWLLWAILPGFGLFLMLQVLRWVVPPKVDAPGEPGALAAGVRRGEPGPAAYGERESVTSVPPGANAPGSPDDAPLG